MPTTKELKKALDQSLQQPSTLTLELVFDAGTDAYQVMAACDRIKREADEWGTVRAMLSYGGKPYEVVEGEDE